MARYAAARFRPVARYKLGVAGSVARRMPAARRLILHTAVSGNTSLFDFFSVPGRSTSHFYVAHDGSVEQYIDTGIRSTANLEANPDSVTVESQDRGGPFPDWDPKGSDVPAWTPKQVEALARLAAWVHLVHGVPLETLPSSRPGTRGVGWHRQGIDPHRVPDGELWSRRRGKVCPGDRRVAQVPAVIARAVALVPEVAATLVPPRPDAARWELGVSDRAFTEMGRRFLVWMTNDEIARTGATYVPGPRYSDVDDFNVRKVQSLMGNPPDPAGAAELGPKQWSRLFLQGRPAGSTLPSALAGQRPPQA
jgi:N-acetylmuramoyl-L-alanine amidase